MSDKIALLVPVAHWDIIHENNRGVIGIRFEHSDPVDNKSFSGLTLNMARDLVFALQAKIDALDATDKTSHITV